MDNPDKEQKPKNSLKKTELVWIAFELGFIIAIPIVIFGMFGKWVDAKSGTYPMFTLIGILSAITSTSFWIYRKFKTYFKQ